MLVGLCFTCMHYRGRGRTAAGRCCNARVHCTELVQKDARVSTRERPHWSSANGQAVTDLGLMITFGKKS